MHTRLEWSQAVLELTRKVRKAIRAIKRDAVVLGETTAGPIGRVWDGGLAADFWPERIPGMTPDEVGPWRRHRPMMDGPLAAAPARYAFPELNYFSNGLNLAELHQVFAAGYSLALLSNRAGSFMFDNAVHIKWLLDRRRRLKHALVYGRQEYQPLTSDSRVLAFFYRARGQRVIVLVNTDVENAHAIALDVAETERNTCWPDAAAPGFVTAEGTRIPFLEIGNGGTHQGIRISFVSRRLFTHPGAERHAWARFELRVHALVDDMISFDGVFSADSRPSAVARALDPEPKEGRQ